MSFYAPESGLVWFAAAAPYVSAAATAINWSFAGLAVYEIFGTDDADEIAEELASSEQSATLVACQEANATGDGLTQGARAYYLKQLDNWRARGKAASLDPVKLASFNDVVGRVATLLQAETDENGQPITFCHVASTNALLERLLTKLGAPDVIVKAPDETAQPVIELNTPPTRKRSLPKWAPFAAVGALGAAFFISR